MSQTEVGPEQEQEEEEHGHPSAGDYVMIAVILAVLTAIEIGLYFAGQAGTPEFATVPALIILTILKFLLVAMWFMHLRFDRPIYTRLFVTGIIVAAVIYGVVVAITLFSTPALG